MMKKESEKKSWNFTRRRRRKRKKCEPKVLVASFFLSFFLAPARKRRRKILSAIFFTTTANPSSQSRMISFDIWHDRWCRCSLWTGKLVGPAPELSVAFLLMLSLMWRSWSYHDPMNYELQDDYEVKQLSGPREFSHLKRDFSFDALPYAADSTGWTSSHPMDFSASKHGKSWLLELPTSHCWCSRRNHDKFNTINPIPRFYISPFAPRMQIFLICWHLISKINCIVRRRKIA